MKFFHLGDLHFGKVVHNIAMVEEDQPFWVEKFLEAVDEKEPDAVVIAGDVYDRKVPSIEAVELFNSMLTELAKRDKYVFIIPGNHDSDIRLSFGNELLKDKKIFIAGKIKKEILHITVGNTCFWLLPYVFPKIISSKEVLDCEDFGSYDLAVRALLNEQEIDPVCCNVLIAHQNVLANGKSPEHSDSETIIGGLGEIDSSAFEAFDYVALGHIHNAQPIGRETVRYAGCPLYYDFSEENRYKGLTLVNIESKEKISVERTDIPLLHSMKTISGTVDEIVEQGLAMENRQDFYFQAKIQDKNIPSHALERLKEVFGSSLINVKKDFAPDRSELLHSNLQYGEKEASMEELFLEFYQKQNDGELLDGIQEKMIARMIEQQSRDGADLPVDAKAIPEEDSKEVVEWIEKLMETV